MTSQSKTIKTQWKSFIKLDDLRWKHIAKIQVQIQIQIQIQVQIQLQIQIQFQIQAQIHTPDIKYVENLRRMALQTSDMSSTNVKSHPGHHIC